MCYDFAIIFMKAIAIRLLFKNVKNKILSINQTMRLYWFVNTSTSASLFPVFFLFLNATPKPTIITKTNETK